MLKKRVILSLCLNNGQLTRTKLFRPDRWYCMNFIDLELADEIVLLDVTRRSRDAASGEWGTMRERFWATVRDFSRNLFLPLSVGGWITTMDDVKRAFAEGADKIVVNTELWRRPDFADEITRKYGSQALVGSLDVREGYAFTHQGSRPTGLTALEAANTFELLHVGEILLMDILRDGSLQGYNLDLLENLSRRLQIPLIAVGGCGNWAHMEAGFAAGADACATQVIHHLTNTSLTACKTYLSSHGVPVRL